MQFKYKEERAHAEDMSGFYIFCFTCNAKVNSKKVLRQFHLNHEVDWLRKKDGERYAFLPDGSVPLINASR